MPDIVVYSDDDDDDDFLEARTTTESLGQEESFKVCQIVSEHLASRTIRGCHLRLHAQCSLFAAWKGVIVLVYQGFPPSLVAAQACIDKAVSNLKEEKFGSKWPKTTLAAVREEAAALSLPDAERLQRVCRNFFSKYCIKMWKFIFCLYR